MSAFTLTHADATKEKVLEAATRVEGVVGKVLNGTPRALGQLDPVDLALLVQFARDTASPLEEAEYRGYLAGTAKVVRMVEAVLKRIGEEPSTTYNAGKHEGLRACLSEIQTVLVQDALKRMQ